MAKNNGKLPLFILLIALIMALCLVIGASNKSITTKTVKFDNVSIANEQTTNDSKDNEHAPCVKSGKIELLCLMYHNIVADNQAENSYEVRVSTIEKDFIELKDMGYKCVDRGDLLEVIKYKKAGKYVMITFDDGFYGVYKYVPTLLKRYNMNCVISVVGEFMEKADKQNYKTRCSYMNSKEVATIAKNPRVEIAHHSYSLHHIKNGMKGVKIAKGENEFIYKERMFNDTSKLEKKMNGLGVKLNTYCYPYGEYCRQSENVLKELGYSMTMTCNEKINILDNKKNLQLIGRINRAAKYGNIKNLINKTCNKK